MNKKLLPFVILLLLGFTSATFSQETEPVELTETETADWSMATQWGLGLKAGLNGLGFEVIKGFGDRLNVRLGYSALTVPYSINQSLEGYDLQADIKATLGGVSGLVDFYLVKGFVHLTAGAMQNNTLIGVDLKSLSSFPYGDIQIPAEDVGSISAELGPGMKVSPYVGLGFGNTLSRKHIVSFNFELGAMYQGSPQLNLTGTGVIGPMASEENMTVINEAIAQYTWFPMMNFQLSFRII